MENFIAWLKEIRWLDIIAIILLMVNMLHSLIKGFAHELISLAALAAGLILAARFSYLGQRYLGGYIDSPHINNTVGFICIFILAVLLGSLLGYLSRRLVKKSKLGPQDRFWGAVLGLVKGTVMLTVLLMLITANLDQGSDIISGSRIARHFSPLPPYLVRLIPSRSRRYFSKDIGLLERFGLTKEKIRSRLESDQEKIKEIIGQHNREE